MNRLLGLTSLFLTLLLLLLLLLMLSLQSSNVAAQDFGALVIPQKILYPPPPSTPWKFQAKHRIVVSFSQAYNIDLESWVKLIDLESGTSWNHKAVSPKGAIGLCQIMPTTAMFFGAKGSYQQIVKDLKNPAINIFYCSKILRYLLKAYNDDWFRVAVAFNSGMGTVKYAQAIFDAKRSQVSWNEKR